MRHILPLLFLACSTTPTDEVDDTTDTPSQGEVEEGIHACAVDGDNVRYTRAILEVERLDGSIWRESVDATGCFTFELVPGPWQVRGGDQADGYLSDWQTVVVVPDGLITALIQVTDPDDSRTHETDD